MNQRQKFFVVMILLMLILMFLPVISGIWSQTIEKNKTKKITFVAPVTPPNITFVTGASSNHFESLVKFLIKFDKYNIDHHKLVIYSLNLTEFEWSVIQDRFSCSTHEFQVFNFTKYPSYFRVWVNKGEYAWKAIIYNKTAAKYGGVVVWMDTGNNCGRNFATLIYDTVSKNGLYSPQSSGTIKQWTYPPTLEYFNYTGNMSLILRSGGLVAANYNISWVPQLINDWAECSFVRQCCAPIGANRENHRQDQASLTILYYQYQQKYKFKILQAKRGFGFHHDEEPYSSLMNIQDKKQQAYQRYRNVSTKYKKLGEVSPCEDESIETI